MSIEEEILSGLLFGEFKSLLECGVEMWVAPIKRFFIANRKYTRYSLKRDNGIVVAWVERQDFNIMPIIFLNKNTIKRLRESPNVLREVIRHELCHIESNALDDEEPFEILAKRRKVLYGDGLKELVW